MQYPKMVYIKAQDVSDGVKEWRIVNDAQEEAQALANGCVLTWRECSADEVKKGRGRPPKAQEQNSGGLF